MRRRPTKSRSLGELIDSNKYRHWIRAGEVVGKLVSREVGVVDRVRETVEPGSADTFRRTIVIELRPNAAQKISKSRSLVLDRWPIITVPKRLHFSEATSSEGENSLPLVTRRENARAAFVHVVWLAKVNGVRGRPGPEVVRRIKHSVGRFITDDAALSNGDRAALLLSDERHKGQPDYRALNLKETAWLKEALKSEEWCQLVGHYQESHLLVPRTAPSSGNHSQTIRYEVLEPKVAAGPEEYQKVVRGEISSSTSKVGRVLAWLKRFLFGKSAPLYVSHSFGQVGRARSHYIHLVTAPGTFIALANPKRIVEDHGLKAINPETQQPYFVHRYAASLERWVFYFRRRSVPRVRNITISCEVWPQTVGFLRPIGFILVYTALGLLGAIYGQLLEQFPSLYVGLGFDLPESLDAAVGLGLFVPALLASLVVTQAQSGLHHKLTYDWKRRAMVSLAFLGAAFAGGLVRTEAGSAWDWAYGIFLSAGAIYVWSSLAGFLVYRAYIRSNLKKLRELKCATGHRGLPFVGKKPLIDNT